MKRETKFLFNQFFEYAIDCGLVENNPTLRIKIKARDTFQHDMENKYKAIPEDVRMKFVIALNQHEFLKPFCMTMMFAGLRAGEALALRWENIDFNHKTITVKNSVTQVPIFDKKGKVLSRKTVIGQTKTNCSVREVPIPDILIDVLKDWRKCQWVRKELSRVDLLAPNAVVFSNEDGSVRTYSRTRRIFDRFAKRNGFYGKIHFHTLRHTYSTMLFEANENPKVIQALLGHKSVKTTITVYNNVNSDYVKESTNRLNDRLNENEILRKQNYQNKEEQEEKKSNLENLSDEDFDLMLEEMLKERKERKRKREKDFEM